MKKRFITAMAAYAILIALAFLLLKEPKILAAAVILLVALALKTLIAMKAGWEAPD